jgi:hypothetical protein
MVLSRQRQRQEARGRGRGRGRGGGTTKGKGTYEEKVPLVSLILWALQIGVSRFFCLCDGAMFVALITVWREERGGARPLVSSREGDRRHRRQEAGGRRADTR